MATRRETPSKPDEWDELADQVLVMGGLHRHDPTVPRIKIGRFDAQIEIGRGGFGIVFKAFDPKLKRWVALKLCRPGSRTAIGELMNEAQVLAGLDHPNIVAVLEPGEHEGSAFFAMPHIDGQNAREFAAREPPPTWREVLDVYIGVASGVAAAHEAGVVHGDIKPSNILLDRDDFPRIADFGLAQRVIEHAEESEQEALRHRAGTLYYMAPERLRGESGDARSDQFSFCVALMQTLDGGVLPFDGETSGELLESIEQTEVRFEDPSLPKELLAVLRIGLSVDPGDRFADMKTLRAELIRLRHSPLDESVLDAPPPDDEDAGPDEPPPSRETTPNEPPEAPLIDAVELRPIAAARPRARAVPRGAFVAAMMLVGVACLAIGRVSLERPSEVSKPVELPYPYNLASMCATGDEEMSIDDEELLKTCTQIRNSQLKSAQTGWQHARNKRLSGDRTALIQDMLVVARTFVDHAVVIQHSGPEDAATAARIGDEWAREAALLIDPREGLNDPRVSEIRTRAAPLLPPQSQHSTTPLPSWEP